MKFIHKVLFVLVICIFGLVLVLTPHGLSTDEILHQQAIRAPHFGGRQIRTGHNNDESKKIVKMENTEVKLRFPHQDEDENQNHRRNNKTKKNSTVVESHSYEEIILPLVYPVHRTLPKRQSLIFGLEMERSKQCNATKLFLESPLLMMMTPSKREETIDQDATTSHKKNTKPPLYQKEELQRIKRLLEKQFETSLQLPLFADEQDENGNLEQENAEQDHFWWIPFTKKENKIVRKRSQKEKETYPDSDYFDAILESIKSRKHNMGEENNNNPRIPCTSEVQYLLNQWQNPPHPRHQTPKKKNNNNNNENGQGHDGSEEENERACDPHIKGLVSPLKSGAHGVGSAVTLLAHDFLSAILIGRRFVLAGSNVNKKNNNNNNNNNNNGGKSTWYFAPEGCEDRGSGGWECLFLPPTKCFRKLNKAEKVHVVRSIASNNNNGKDHYFDADANPAAWNRHRLITKSAFDIPGLSRNEFPSIEKFFDTLLSVESNTKRKDAILQKCVPLVKNWVAGGGVDDEYNLWSARNRILMGTFKNAANPVLIYELAQVTSYLLRGLQPWFKQVIQAHLRKTMFGVAKMPTQNFPKSLIFIHDRGEIAKYREYYNSFGCHKFNQVAYQRELTDFLCPVTNQAGKALIQQRQQENPSSWHPSSDTSYCTVFVSGNMPFAEYEAFKQRIAEANDHLIRSLRPPAINNNELVRRNDKNAFAARNLAPIFVVQSTWNLTSSREKQNTNNNNNHGGGNSKVAETARWGASHPAASWVDLFAGMHATGWACVVQSNWCRVVDFLRMTLTARADCPFVDMGMASLSDGELRLRYCIVKDEWPKKPFSSLVGKNLKLI